MEIQEGAAKSAVARIDDRFARTRGCDVQKRDRPRSSLPPQGLRPIGGLHPASAVLPSIVGREESHELRGIFQL
jgi:hypothetical protein